MRLFAGGRRSLRPPGPRYGSAPRIGAMIKAFAVILLAAMATSIQQADPPATDDRRSTAPKLDCTDPHMDLREVSITCFADGAPRGRPGSIYNAPLDTGLPAPPEALTVPRFRPGVPGSDYSGTGYSAQPRSRSAGTASRSVPRSAAGRPRSNRPASRAFTGACPCGSGRICIGPRGGRYCITSGGNRRYGL